MKKEMDESSITLPNTVLFGRYLLTRKIGHGGMAEVFLGRDVEADLEAPVRVVKCILPELASDPRFLAMFINEAQLAAQMSHPNIVKVLDFGEFEGRLFMVMEYVEGLDCWRFARRLYPWGDDHTAMAVWVICRVLDALNYAHGMTDVNGQPLNVIHRDLSPSNIYLSMDGVVKLGDFGIARIDSTRYRQIPMIPKGKFGYVAPEQVEGLQMDSRADIFAVGIVLAELLIGKKIFSGQSQLSVMLEIKEARLDALVQNADRVEPELLEILHGSLARRPEERYGSVAEFKQVLSDYIEGQGRTLSSTHLAKQVRRAVELSEQRSSMPVGVQPATLDTQDITPIDAAVLAPISIEPTTEPAGDFGKTPLSPESFIEEGESTPFAETPITRDSLPLEGDRRYTARLTDGRTIGPTSYAHILELVCSDEIGPDTPISVDGYHFVPASARSELTRHLPAYTPAWDTGELATPDRRGILQLEAPAEIVISLATRTETGMLVCKQGLRRKEVYLRNGIPVYVSSNDSSELLGEFLVSKGALERAELELALALLPKFNGHMGDTIIALGMLSAVELFNYIGDQIKSRFTELIDWKYGNYEFYKGTSCRPDVFEVTIDPFQFVSECLLISSEKIPVASTLSSMSENIVMPSNFSMDIIEKLILPKDIEHLLRDLTEPSALSELTDTSKAPGSKESLVRALYLALETGFWTVDGTSPPWRAPEKNSF
ncbi:MAG: serine/threonine protein kinase [Deltaproteobacteria bacterium]|nr:serine/threonine protein kinase [Deltaproteobacteria bacterium]